VGLTGGIASGKSTVASRFAELGVPVIDADVVSRQVVEPGRPGLAQIVARFGAEVLTQRGELDRAKLRAHIFQDSAERRALEQILHPLIRREMSAQATAAQAPYLIMAIPLLIESGAAHERVDRVLVVDVPEETQIERLRLRDGTDPDQARAILESQARRQDRLAVADDILPNTGDIEQLRNAVDQLHAQYLQWPWEPSAR
jgi:dephospho-CoA kinase